MITPLTETRLPWYRHPWPWILMAGPFVVVVAGAVTAYLAVSSNDGLVDDDYYKQGLAVNKLTARDQQALALGVQADVMQGVAGAQIRVLLRGNPDFVVPDLLTLRVIHPTRGGGDQTIMLRADGAGSYTARLAAPLAGRWHIALEDGMGGWRLTGDWDLAKDASLRLPSAPRSAADLNNSNDHRGR